jgi:hypothetical protein
VAIAAFLRVAGRGARRALADRSAFRALGPLSALGPLGALSTLGTLFALRAIFALLAIVALGPVVALVAIGALLSVVALGPIIALRAVVALRAVIALAAIVVVIVAFAGIELIVVAVVVVHVVAAARPLLVEARLAFAEHAEIMVRILQIIFGLDAVARKLRVARHALVLFEQLRRIATLAIVLAIAGLSAPGIRSSLPTATAPAATLTIIDQMLLPYAVVASPLGCAGQAGFRFSGSRL